MTPKCLIVNTCAFIDSAKQESIDSILEMARHKIDGSCKRLIVTGCMAERYREELKKEIPEIDAVLGTGQVPEIVGAITGGATPMTFYRSGPPARWHPAPSSWRVADLHLRRRHAPAHGDAEALRLREDRRRLRLQVRVLHHPDAARGLSQPAGGFDRT